MVPLCSSLVYLNKSNRIRKKLTWMKGVLVSCCYRSVEGNGNGEQNDKCICQAVGYVMSLHGCLSERHAVWERREEINRTESAIERIARQVKDDCRHLRPSASAAAAASYNQWRCSRIDDGRREADSQSYFRSLDGQTNGRTSEGGGVAVTSNTHEHSSTVYHEVAKKWRSEDEGREEGESERRKNEQIQGSRRLSSPPSFRLLHRWRRASVGLELAPHPLFLLLPPLRFPHLRVIIRTIGEA